MMNRYTGHAIDEDAHIRQSIGDILLTPVGSRVERREYGSLLTELIDQPGNDATRLRLMASATMAIYRWEPRISIKSIVVAIAADGRAVIEIETTRKGGQRSGRAINFSVPIQ